MKNNKAEQPEKYIREDDPELKNSEELIDYLTDAYSLTGDMSYRDCLIDCFDGYFVKYVSLMCHHNKGVNVNNKDTRNFLRLFMNKKDRANAFTYEQGAGLVVHKIRRTVRLFTPADIYNELIVHFLELLEKYKPISYKRGGKISRISFAHYIQVNMRYRLNNWILKKGKDILTGSDWVQYHDCLHEDECPHQDDESDTCGISLEEWVWGDQANAVFSELSEAERYLLWLKYEGDPSGRLTMRDLAVMMGVHYQTIVKRMIRIKKKLKVAIEEVGDGMPRLW